MVVAAPTLVLRSELTKILQVLEDLLLLVVPHEPQGALVDEEAPGQQEPGWYELHGHRNTPACCAGRVHVLCDPVVDPESQNGPDLVDNLEQAGENTTDRRNRQLGDVAGYCRCDYTAAKTCENTTSICNKSVFGEAVRHKVQNIYIYIYIA